MIPLVGFPNELEEIRKEAETIVQEISGGQIPVLIGTMIELPRACMVADEIAKRTPSSPSALTT